MRALPYTFQPPQAQQQQRCLGTVSTGVKAAIATLVILNLAQVNLLSWGQRSGACSGQRAGRQHAGGQVARSSVRHWNPFRRRQAGGVRDASLPFPEQHFALFVIFSWNRNVLLTSVESYAAAGFGRRIVIIDNSPGKSIAKDGRLLSLVGEIIPTRTRLTFSQSQNLIAEIAIEREYDFYMWGHSDVAVLAKDAASSFAGEVLACVAAAYRVAPAWGVLYFAYDWFSAIRTDVVRKVQYDTFITVYKSDCDYYPRVREAGFTTLNYEEVRPGVVGKVYDLNSALEVPWGDYEAAKAALDAHEAAMTSRFDWKFDSWGPDEVLGWDLWEHTSHRYFRAKWGPPVDENPAQVCRIEVPNMLTGRDELVQQPFSSLDSLQRTNWLEEDLILKGYAALKGITKLVGGSKAYMDWAAMAERVRNNSTLVRNSTLVT